MKYSSPPVVRVNSALSAPPVTDHPVMGSSSGSVASRVTTAVWFSCMVSGEVVVMIGGVLVGSGVAVVADTVAHWPLPSSFLARTCTWCVVLGARPVIVVLVVLPSESKSWSFQWLLPRVRYWTS